MTTEPHLPPSCAQRFRPERVLAQGGYGTVWLAHQVSLNRRVAVKVLHGEVLADDTAVKRFLNEARVTAQLTHPNIVVLMDHDVENGVPWIAYEYVPGKSLRDKIALGRLPWPEAVGIALQIAAALEAAHAHGVLHRDIKPDNVLEAEDGHFKVADFGIARQQNMEGLTAKGQIVGTPAYLSPVQLRGEVPGPESDIYALGITLYELVTGELPFTDDNVVRLMQRHMMQAPPKPSSKVEGLPVGLDAVVAKALSKKREDRYDQVSEMSAALRALVREGHIAPDPARGATRAPAAPARGSGRHARTARASVATGALSASGTRAVAINAAGAPPISGSAKVSAARMVAALALGAALMAIALRPAAVVAPPGPSASALATAASPAPASGGPTLATVVSEPRTHLRDFHIVPGPEFVAVVIARDQPVELRVTLREVGSQQLLHKLDLAPRPLRTRTLFPRLRPDRPYVLEAHTAGGAPLILRYPFRTKSKSRDARTSATAFLDDPLVAQVMKHEAPDDDDVPTLLEVAARAAPGSGALEEVTTFARELRHPALSAALLRRLPEVSGPGNRAAILAVAVHCEVPGAVQAAIAELPRLTAVGRDALVMPLRLVSSASPAPALIESLESLPGKQAGPAGTMLAETAPELALATFDRWLSKARPDDPRELAWAAEEGLSILGAERARPLVSKLLADGATREAGLGAAVAVGDGLRELVEHALAESPDDVRVQRAAAYLGSPKSIDFWTRQALQGSGNRTRAATTLAGPDSPSRRAALKRVLASPDARVASAAAWAAGHARIGGLAAELATIEPARDPTHYALWARARTGDATAASAIMAALQSVADLPRTTAPNDCSYRLLAAAAAELGVTAAAGPLDAIAKRRNDPCVIAAREHLAGSPARFAVLHPEVTVVRTGEILKLGECTTISGWPLDDAPPKNSDYYRNRKLGLHYLTADDAPCELRSLPRTFLARVGYEIRIARSRRIALDAPAPRQGAFLVLMQ